jgi:hypothetical protein
MPSSYLNFRFRYLNEQGKPTSVRYYQARIDDGTGIMLDNDAILIADIHEVFLYDNRIAIILRPFISLSKNIAENIIPHTSSIIIEVADNLASDAKSAIDQHRSALLIYAKKNQLSKEGKGYTFKAKQCPNCNALIDVTGLKETLFVYCKYCEVLFDKHNDLLPNSENYKICPECNYYNRVQYYPEFHFYALPKNIKAKYQSHYCCDTCAQRYHEQTAWRNGFYLIGIPFNIYLKNKMSKGTNQLYAGLTEANRFAQDGNIREADIIYGSLLIRNEMHPGIYFNLGQAFFKAANEDIENRTAYLEKSYRYFEKSLEMCSNYQPTIDFLAFYKSLSWKVIVNE